MILIRYEVMMSCWNARARARPTFPELHARLDTLLLRAADNDYLTLQLDECDRPLTPKHSRYRAWRAR